MNLVGNIRRHQFHVLGAALVVLVAAGHAAQGLPRRILLSEGPLRKLALSTPLPRYPQKSVRQRKQGVGVSQILVNEKGVVAATRILEAPDDHIAKAVEAAVKKWTFRPQTVKGKPVSVSGKLTFYFVIERAGARVVSPDEMPEREE